MNPQQHSNAREKAMFDATRGSRKRCEPCVCGEDIYAEVGWEAAAIDEHNRGLTHQLWRRWREAIGAQ